MPYHAIIMSLVARIRPSHWLAAVWLAFVVACGIWAGQRLLAGQALETNLLALLPSTERNPRAEKPSASSLKCSATAPC